MPLDDLRLYDRRGLDDLRLDDRRGRVGLRLRVYDALTLVEFFEFLGMFIWEKEITLYGAQIIFICVWLSADRSFSAVFVYFNLKTYF